MEHLTVVIIASDNYKGDDIMYEYLQSLSVDECFIILALVCLFLHIIADYLVQNDFMAKYKQVKNWEQYIKETGKYKHDYIVVLLVHAFSWSFITFIPLFIFTNYNVISFAIVVITNTLVHAIIDDLKCNKLKINLIEDQLFHLCQIVMTIVIIGTIFSVDWR